MNKQDLQKQLEKLRKEWRDYPLKRPIIERQAKAVKRALGVTQLKIDDTVI